MRPCEPAGYRCSRSGFGAVCARWASRTSDQLVSLRPMLVASLSCRGAEQRMGLRVEEQRLRRIHLALRSVGGTGLTKRTPSPVRPSGSVSFGISWAPRRAQQDRVQRSALLGGRQRGQQQRCRLPHDVGLELGVRVGVHAFAERRGQRVGIGRQSVDVGHRPAAAVLCVEPDQLAVGIAAGTARWRSAGRPPWPDRVGGLVRCARELDVGATRVAQQLLATVRAPLLDGVRRQARRPSLPSASLNGSLRQSRMVVVVQGPGWPASSAAARALLKTVAALAAWTPGALPLSPGSAAMRPAPQAAAVARARPKVRA